MEDNKFAVMIPCAQEDFASFISGLLGKPQTLERMHVSAFEVNRLGIENLFHLIDQRLKQQNDATLVQFTKLKGSASYFSKKIEADPFN